MASCQSNWSTVFKWSKGDHPAHRHEFPRRPLVSQSSNPPVSRFKHIHCKSLPKHLLENFQKNPAAVVLILRATDCSPLKAN